MTAFQRLCLLTGVVIFGLIVLGGVVRATDSGLGCPDWPRCHGSFIPKWEKHTLIEYSHRATASVAGLLALSLLVVAWRKYRRVPAITYPATAVMLLIVVQAWLGKETVERELPPEIVAVHLTMALTIVSVLALLTTTAFALEGQSSRLEVSQRLGRIAIAASAVTLVLMIVGSYVAGAGYGLACNGWPLCNGEVVPGADAASVQVHFLHRVLALVLGLVLLALLWAAGRERSSAPVAFRLSVLALGLFIAQALVGAANIWTKLASEVVAVHLGLGALLWITLAVLNIRAHRLDELLSRSTGEAGRRDLVGAPR
jgi:heme A synthase